MNNPKPFCSLSVVILTLNEEERISKAVKSVAQHCGQLIIVDSFSTDQTIQRVKKTWLKAGREARDLVVVVQKWQGFTKTRNESVQWASCPWIFWLDADEWVDSNTFFTWFKNHVENSLSEVSSVFRFPRRSKYMNHWIRFGGWSPDLKSRLAKKNQSQWQGGNLGSDVHEDLHSLDGKPAEISPEYIFHLPFLSLQEHLDTNRRYSTLMAEAVAIHNIKNKKKPPSWAFIYIKSFVKFVENYIFKLGILDLWPGLVIAYFSALSMKWRLQKVRQIMSSSTFKQKGKIETI